ncbi:MAG: uracil-DNA glycosylase [Polyangia bacterium]
MHAPPGAESGELLAELRALSQGLRAHLGWLQEGGVVGLPRPRPLARRPEPVPPRRDLPPSGQASQPAPDPAHRVAAVEPQIAEHHDLDIAAAARRALEVTARAAGASGPRSAPPAAAPPAGLPGFTGLPAPGPAVEVPELVALRTGSRLQGAAGLQEVRAVLGDCQRCKLCHGRTTLVYGEGSPHPLIAFVGEGPGADEDRQGRPFVGAAGELLNRMIKAMANEASKHGRPDLAARLSREEVYIANVVKCRPPGNRTPEPDEIAACGGFLRAQLECLKPHVKVVVALGRTPTQFLLQSGAPISRLRGQFQRLDGLPVMPTFHPAYLLRTESAKKLAWDDLKQVLGLLLAEVPPT